MAKNLISEEFLDKNGNIWAKAGKNWVKNPPLKVKIPKNPYNLKIKDVILKK